MIERVFPAEEDALFEVQGFLEEELEKAGCSMKMQIALSVAIEEVFVNVAHYAYPEGNGKVWVDFDFDSSSRTAVMQISDRGVPFDPLKKPDPDITLSAEDRPIGGLGIFITKKTMDQVSYRYEDGKNILTMYKNI